MSTRKPSHGGRRKGAGRPAVHDTPLETISIALTRETLKNLDTLCRELELNRSRSIAKLIDTTADKSEKV